MDIATVDRPASGLREENEQLRRENNALKANIAYWRSRHHDAVEREEAAKKAPADTEDLTLIVTLEVRGYQRRIRRKKYKRGCRCPGSKGITTARGPEKLSITPLTQSGYSREEILRQWRCRPPEHPHSLDAIHRRKDATEFPAGVTTGVVGFADKKHIIALVRDTTERERAEREKARLQEAKRLQAVGRLAGGGWHTTATTC